MLENTENTDLPSFHILKFPKSAKILQYGENDPRGFVTPPDRTNYRSHYRFRDSTYGSSVKGAAVVVVVVVVMVKLKNLSGQSSIVRGFSDIPDS